MTCPDWNLERIIEQSVGIDAIDFRGLEGEMKLWNTPEFRVDEIENTLFRIRNGGLVVSGISTSARINPAKPNSFEEIITEVTESARIAKRIGAEHIRIFLGDKSAGPPGPTTCSEIARLYRRLCESISDTGIMVLAETHDVCANSTILARILGEVGHDLTGAIWDVRHPYEKAGESFEQTATVLAPFLKLVHVKDFTDGGGELVFFGTGALDSDRIVAALGSCGYDGYITLEQPRVDATGKAEPEENIKGFVEAFDKHRG